MKLDAQMEMGKLVERSKQRQTNVQTKTHTHEHTQSDTNCERNDYI